MRDWYSKIREQVKLEPEFLEKEIRGKKYLRDWLLRRVEKEGDAKQKKIVLDNKIDV